MRILGIDPGYERLGIAILEKEKWQNKKERVVFSECFKTSSDFEFHKRLGLVGKEIERVIKKYKPEMLSIETLFLNTNQKTAMRVAEVRGTILYVAQKEGLEIFEAAPPEIKIAITGYGKADKAQVIKMVKMLVNFEEKKDKKSIESDDELDAIATALTAFARAR